MAWSEFDSVRYRRTLDSFGIGSYGVMLVVKAIFGGYLAIMPSCRRVVIVLIAAGRPMYQSLDITSVWASHAVAFTNIPTDVHFGIEQLSYVNRTVLIAAKGEDNSVNQTTLPNSPQYLIATSSGSPNAIACVKIAIDAGIHASLARISPYLPNA